MSGRAAAALRSGTATRTTSQPAAASLRICSSVAFGSRVSAVVIDWTTIGLLPPILTSPTCKTRVLRREANSISLYLLRSGAVLRQERIPIENTTNVPERDHEHQQDQRDQASEVDQAFLLRRDLATAADELDQDEEQATAVERRQRQQVQD